eukprot:g4875.t1
MASDQDNASTRSETASAVSGVPLIPIYQTASPPPEARIGFQQQQFPPPVPQSYVHQGMIPPYGKDDPPPPSIYYSRYVNPQQPVNYGPMMGLYATPTVSPFQVTHHQPAPDQNYTMDFSEDGVRESFVQKVLLLILIQLVAMIGFSLLCLEVEYIKDELVESNKWLIGLALFICFLVLVLRRIHSDGVRKRPRDVFVFLLWSIGLIMLLAWTITLLTLHFFLVTLILLGTLFLSFLLSSYLFARPLISVRSGFISVFAILIVSLLLLIVYKQSVQNVFFANFTSMIVMMLLFFRLHYLMGDQIRKLKQHEYFHAATCILF